MIKYSVIESQGKIIAKIDDCKYDVVNLINRKAGIEIDSEELLLKSSYKGVSKCHPDDVFNLLEGKKLAEERMLAKYRKDFNKALMFSTDLVHSMYEDMAALEQKHFFGL